ncbi:MAG TPA: hypothetical protein VHM00_17640 [Caldimonas sp.]|jgi:hypothetical protein|nr:hypothetical protein [Caldimonas sp.]HEX2542890.1 hypothetical protein [Caldimonas sp.]
MSEFPESTLPRADDGPSFLSRVGLAFVLLTAGIGVALALAAA